MIPSPDWLATVLNKPIEKLAVELIGNFSSEVSRLHLNSESQAQTLILKRRRPDRGERIGESFVTEGKFYGSIAPNLNVRLPECFGFSDDFILLEDVATQKISFGNGATPEHIERALLALRTLHRTLPTTDCDWIPSFADPHFNNKLADQFNKGWDQNRDVLLDLCPEFLTPGDHLLTRMQDYYGQLGQQPTLLQGDAHLENIPLIEESCEVVFFDWQGPRIGNPIFDVAYFLVMSLPIAERRRSEMRWLSVYLGREVKPGDLVSYRFAVAARASGIVELLAGESNILDQGLSVVAKRCLTAAADHAVQELII